MTIRRALSLGGLALGVTCVFQGGSAQDAVPLDRLSLPPGFRIEVYAEGLTSPRSMVLSENGTLFVGTRVSPQAMQRGAGGGPGVYAIRDRDGDGRADEIVEIGEGLNVPNGVAFDDGDLYVAEISRILRYDDIESRLEDPPEPVVVTDVFPTDWLHGWKFIAFGPDGKLYVPVGAPCNVCDRSADEPVYAAITRMNPDGTELEIYASGIRNSVGFDWHPGTADLWFTSNGRDGWGDDRPPDTLNRAATPGLHFGYPYCHGGDMLDPEFGEGRSCDDYEPPARNLGPHVASLGMRFYTGEMFPEAYRGQIFIAEHGSWNRSPEAGHTGHRITIVRLEGSEVVGYEPFAEGWLQADNTAWGRPVDILVMPDGALLVSDDTAGVIYRISYDP